MKQLFLLLLLFTSTAHGEIKISQLPLKSASGVSTNDAVPMYDSVSLSTKRIKLSDLVNVPAFAAMALPSQVGNVNKCLVTDGSSTSWSLIGDSNLNSGIARAKLASGTANHVLINSGAGAMSSEATLAVSRGGTGLATLTANNVLLGNGTSSPSFVAPSTSGNLLTSNGTTWASTAPTYPDQSDEVSNAGFATSIGSSALTVALKTKAGTDPTSTDIVKIGFRSSTLTTGTYAQRTVTGALSIVIPSTTTLGMTSGQTHRVYLYAIDNAGTPELALSLSGWWEEGSLVSTTAIAAGASLTTLYSTTARTNVALRRLGSFLLSEVTAGTYLTAPTELSLPATWPTRQLIVGAVSSAQGTVTSASFANFASGPTVTIVPVRTKRYKVSLSTVYTIGTTNDISLQLAASAGTPTLVYQNGGFIRFSSSTFIVPQHLWAIYDLVAGTTYTFVAQGSSAGGTVTLRGDLGGGAAIIVEEMN